jgi:glucosamine--fructose-6-phosphate aminotransferase (isomerizing)
VLRLVVPRGQGGDALLQRGRRRRAHWPILPGEFRGQYAESLRDGDLFVAVSQSGETKDLIDVLNAVMATGRDIGRVALVNNVNSTLAQEKSDVVIPLRCGPEVAVPATKSFINQLTVFYCLALRLAARRLPTLDAVRRGASRRAGRAASPAREAHLRAARALRETVATTDAEVERAAQLLYLAPSMHMLATRITAVAKEGALKIREVVLNHTEGFEGSEFKHGPNTILGFNTVLGTGRSTRCSTALGAVQDALAARAARRALGPTRGRLATAPPTRSSPRGRAQSHPRVRACGLRRAFGTARPLLGALYQDYPLVYVTGPDERDVNLTVSAINTHKIRGASTVVIAEESPRACASRREAPRGQPPLRRGLHRACRAPTTR